MRSIVCTKKPLTDLRECKVHLLRNNSNCLKLLMITGTNIQVSIKGNDYNTVGKVVEKKKRY